MSSLRFITLITPNNDSIRVEISGDEMQLLELLSMVTGIPVFDIKGIRDSYGNYYTISSAITHPRINSEFSDVYYLVCNNATIIQPLNQKENFHISNANSNLNENDINYLNNQQFNENIFDNKLNINLKGIMKQASCENQYLYSKPKCNKQKDFNPFSNSNNHNFINSNNHNVINSYNRNEFFNNRNAKEPIQHRSPDLNSFMNGRLSNANENFHFSQSNDIHHGDYSKMSKNKQETVHQQRRSQEKINYDYIPFKNKTTKEIYNVRNPYSTNMANNTNSFFLPEFEKKLETISNNKNSQEGVIKYNEVDKYLNIAQELFENGYLNNKYMPLLCKLIIRGNEKVLNLMDFYIKEIIDINSLISSLNKIFSSSSKSHTEENSTYLIKTKLSKLIEQFEKQICVDIDDFLLLKKLIEYENESIFRTFEVYEKDKNLLKFIDSMKHLIQQGKIQSNTYFDNFMKNIKPVKDSYKLTNETKKLKSDRNLSSVTINQTAEFQSITNNFHYPNKKKTEIEEELKIELKGNAKKYNLSKEVESNILSALHTEERSIFKYAIKNKYSEIDLIAQLYESFQKEDILVKPARLLCQKLMNEIILKEFSDSELYLFNELLEKRNKNLLTIFKGLNEHGSLSKLESEVKDFIRTISNKKHLKNERKRTSSSDSDFLVEKEDEKEKIRELQTQNTPKEINSQNRKNIGPDEFMQLVDIMKFLKPEEKKELGNMVKNKNKIAMDIVENYNKNKSIVSLKMAVLSIFGKKSSPKNINIMQDKNANISNFDVKKKRVSVSSNKTIVYQNISSLEQLLGELVKTGKISSHQHKLLLKKYEYNDEAINSAWEVYTNTKDLGDLIESLKILTNNVPKSKSITQSDITPAGIKTRKSEYIEFIKDESNKKEKEAIKVMQFNMIKILARDNMVDINSLEFFKDIIMQEDLLLISAFEVFGVTKDHKDFTHTLNLIANICNPKSNTSHADTKHNLNNAFVASTNNSIFNITDSKDINLLNLFENFLSKSNLSAKNKEILKLKFEQRDQFIMSSLELYEKSNDDNEFLETLTMYIKK